jgi:hypothetical protein
LLSHQGDAREEESQREDHHLVESDHLVLLR